MDLYCTTISTAETEKEKVNIGHPIQIKKIQHNISLVVWMTTIINHKGLGNSNILIST